MAGTPQQHSQFHCCPDLPFLPPVQGAKLLKSIVNLLILQLTEIAQQSS